MKVPAAASVGGENDEDEGRSWIQLDVHASSADGKPFYCHRYGSDDNYKPKGTKTTQGTSYSGRWPMSWEPSALVHG
jgi:hypothetical protein